MPRKPIQSGPEEGGRSHMRAEDLERHHAQRDPERRGEQRGGQQRIRPPPPAPEADAGLEASIRLKLDAHEPLNAQERAYLARLPGDHEVRY